MKLTVVSGEIKRGLDLLVRQKPNLKAIFLGTRRTDPYSQDLKKHQVGYCYRQNEARLHNNELMY